MMSIKRSLLFCFTFVLFSCSLNKGNLNSVLWIQTSSEYEVASKQVYKIAESKLHKAVSDSSWTALPLQTGREGIGRLKPAVIMDIDETVLDNSVFNARLIRDGESYSDERMDEWISSAAASAVPGSVSYINVLLKNGVEVVYITNRQCMRRQSSKDFCPQKQDTIRNLKKVGIASVNEDNLLLLGEKNNWTSEKESRRRYVAEKYRVVMLLGDDLGDFLDDVKNSVSIEDRYKKARAYDAYWTDRWFLVSNPIYGSWFSILKGNKEKYLRTQ